MLFDVPIHRHPPAAIAQMPLAQQVLIPSPEVFGVRGTGRGTFTPDRRRAHAEDGIDDFGDRVAQGIGMEIATPDIDQILSGLPRERGTDPFEAGIRTEPKQTQQESAL